MNNLADFEKVKFQYERNNIIPGFYTIHCPSQCNLKFPKDNRPIHKKSKNAYEGKETINILQNSKWRRILIPKEEKNAYPAIISKKLCGVFKKYAFPHENFIPESTSLDDKLEKSEYLKNEFKTKKKPQPGNQIENLEHAKPNIKAHANFRTEALHNEEFQGARIANQIILASKCRAIRDAQLIEKFLIKKQIKNENKRMDEIMEKARISALEKERKEHNERKVRRLENIKIIKDQILRNKIAKTQELENIEKEYIKLNKTGVIILNDDDEKIKQKRENAAQLMEHLNKCNEELLEHKEKKLHNDKVLEERIKKFIQYRKERDNKIKSNENAKKNIREKNIFSIIKAQEIAKKLKEEMEMLRIQKIQEDVEKVYREKEKTIAIKKANELVKLKEGREKQIADVRTQIAAEISREDEIFKNIVQKNEKDILKEQEKLRMKQEALKEHRQSIIKQIDEKERKKIDTKERVIKECLVINNKIEKQKNLEKSVVEQKVEQMREQKIPEIYVNEVRCRLAKLKYI